jgi:hypothetical protein
LAAVAVLVGVRPVNAQDVTWGVKGGVALASLNTSGEGSFETSSDVGGALGGFVSLTVAPGVTFQPEVLLTTRRFSVFEAATPFSVAATSVEIPLLVHLKVPRQGQVQAALFAGPVVAAIAEVEQAIGETRSDISDHIETLDAGLAFGGGIEFQLPHGAVLFDIRIAIGVRELNENPGPSFNSRAVMALVGYRFRR